MTFHQWLTLILVLATLAPVALLARLWLRGRNLADHDVIVARWMWAPAMLNATTSVASVQDGAFFMAALQMVGSLFLFGCWVHALRLRAA